MLREQLDPKLPDDGRPIVARLKELFSQGARVTRQLQSPPVLVAAKSGSQALSGATTITWGTETYDTHEWFASNAYTPLETGYYRVSARLTFESSPSSSNTCTMYVRVGGTVVAASRNTQTASGQVLTAEINTIVWCNGSTDYIDVQASSSGAQNIDGEFCGLAIHFIGADQIA